MTRSIELLKKVDWDFADYSRGQFPVDINALHWYPAAFVPQIPSILISALSSVGETVLDPFAGSGVTLIEAARLDRRFVGADINPVAIDIIQAKIQAVHETDDAWYAEETRKVTSASAVQDANAYCELVGIDSSVTKWFAPDTLQELLVIHNYIEQNKQAPCHLLRRVLLSSILNRACSQRDHYTYITDNCYPNEMIYRPAKQMFLEQLALTAQAAREIRMQFQEVHGCDWDIGNAGIIKCCDARQIGWIQDCSVDLVVTSPPYVGVNDYVRSMRLRTLFYPEQDITSAIASEIGARRKRNRKDAFDEYINDMKSSLSEIVRVLRPGSFLCLVLGSGRGRVNREDPVSRLADMLRINHGFTVDYEIDRRIKFRRIQVAGVGTEKILVLSQKG